MTSDCIKHNGLVESLANLVFLCCTYIKTTGDGSFIRQPALSFEFLRKVNFYDCNNT